MYEAKCLVPYVPTHNVAMLVSAALYSGRMQLAGEYSPYILMSPDSAVYLSAIYASPKDIVMVRYGQWDQVFYLQEQQQKVRVKARIKSRARVRNMASAYLQYYSYCILLPVGIRTTASERTRNSYQRWGDFFPRRGQGKGRGKDFNGY